MAISSTKGIKIGLEGEELSEKAYGGYAFSANYSINFTQPSKMTVSFVSEDGTYDEKTLAARIFPGQQTNHSSVNRDIYNHIVKPGDTIQSIAVQYNINLDNLVEFNRADDEDWMGTYNRLSSLYKDQSIKVPKARKIEPISVAAGGAIHYDIIQFAGQTFKMHPLKYSITEGADGRYMQIDYYDRSIKYLDKAIVVINNKHLPPVYDPAYPPFIGGPASNTSNIIAIGSPYVNAKERNSGRPGSPTKNGDAQKLVPTYLYSPADLFNGIMSNAWLAGMVDAASCQILAQYPLLYGGSNGNDKFLKDHVGTLRDVLNAWAQDLGFIFYWEPTSDQLKIMDLRSDLSFNRIQKTVSKVVAARNITERNWSYSIEDTFSKGAAAYWARDGMPEGDSSVEPFYLLDLLELSVHRCYSADKEVTCSDEAISISNFVDYCGAGPPHPWAASTMRGRTDNDELMNYIRLLKAAAIGPEFYKIYILNKKAAGNTGKFSDYGSGHPAVSLYEDRKISSVELAEMSSGVTKYFWGGDNTKLSGQGTVDLGISKNDLVDELYNSTSPTSFNQAHFCKSGDQIVDSWIEGNDCISIELLRDRGSEQIDQLYRLSEARLINASAKSTARLSSSGAEGGGEDAGDPGKPYYFFRMKKYGISSFIENTSEDHIFKLLNGIAMNQGRFYYSRTLQTSAQFSEKSYDEKNVNWYDRAVDVADTPLGELYYATDPQASLASNPMPNQCIEHKGVASRQVKADGTAFEDPANTARPTIEQFIQSIYGDTVTDKRQGGPASLSVSLSGGAVSSISVSDGGENYLGGGNGSAAVTITPAEAGKGAGATAEATIENGQVVSVSVTSGGSGYTSGTQATVAGGTSSTGEDNVFGGANGDYNEENYDSILASNLAELTEEKKSKCEETDGRFGIVLADLGSSIKIPNLIQQRIERHVQSFGVIPTSTNLKLITYLDEAGYQVLSLAKCEDIEAIREDNGDWFSGRGEYAPKDELDFIVDQVEIPKLDAMFGEDGKNKISLTSNFTFAGDYFETKAMIRPLHESNVREVNMEFLTPSEKDLGVLDGDCIEDGEEAEKKRKRDDQLIQSNIAAYANAFAYQQQRVEYNAQVSVVDDQIRDTDGEKINITVEKGLESISARIGDDGVKLSYGVGTRRKRRVINKPFEDLWLRVKPEFYNNVFDV